MKGRVRRCSLSLPCDSRAICARKGKGGVEKNICTQSTFVASSPNPTQDQISRKWGERAAHHLILDQKYLAQPRESRVLSMWFLLTAVGRGVARSIIRDPETRGEPAYPISFRICARSIGRGSGEVSCLTSYLPTIYLIASEVDQH